MWTVKEGGSKEHGSLWDQVHHMLMVYWTAGVCLYPMFLCSCLIDVKASVSKYESFGVSSETSFLGIIVFVNY